MRTEGGKAEDEAAAATTTWEEEEEGGKGGLGGSLSPNGRLRFQGRRRQSGRGGGRGGSLKRGGRGGRFKRLSHSPSRSHVRSPFPSPHFLFPLLPTFSRQIRPLSLSCSSLSLSLSPSIVLSTRRRRNEGLLRQGELENVLNVASFVGSASPLLSLSLSAR